MSDEKVAYRVVLRARLDGGWDVRVSVGKQRLFSIPYSGQKGATWVAAKLVDDMRRNGHKVRWVVQDEDGDAVKSPNLDGMAERVRTP